MRAVVIAILALAASIGTANPLGDRLILSVNGNAFSQWQCEVYLAIASLLGIDRGAFVRIHEGNWTEALTRYRRDMIIYAEAQRLSRFLPEKRLVLEQIERLNGEIAKAPALGRRFRGLNIDRTALLVTISDVLQVAQFQRNEMHAESDEWFNALEKRSVVRLYKGWDRFETLTPPGEKR